MGVCARTVSLAGQLQGCGSKAMPIVGHAHRVLAYVYAHLYARCARVDGCRKVKMFGRG